MNAQSAQKMSAHPALAISFSLGATKATLVVCALALSMPTPLFLNPLSPGLRGRTPLFS
jgi:hypothetical protein